MFLFLPQISRANHPVKCLKTPCGSQNDLYTFKPTILVPQMINATIL